MVSRAAGVRFYPSNQTVRLSRHRRCAVRPTAGRNPPVCRVLQLGGENGGYGRRGIAIGSANADAPKLWRGLRYAAAASRRQDTGQQGRVRISSSHPFLHARQARPYD